MNAFTRLSVVIGASPEMSGHSCVDRVRRIQLYKIASDPYQKRAVLPEEPSSSPSSYRLRGALDSKHTLQDLGNPAGESVTQPY